MSLIYYENNIKLRRHFGKSESILIKKCSQPWLFERPKKLRKKLRHQYKLTTYTRKLVEFYNVFIWFKKLILLTFLFVSSLLIIFQVPMNFLAGVFYGKKLKIKESSQSLFKRTILYDILQRSFKRGDFYSFIDIDSDPNKSVSDHDRIEFISLPLIVNNLKVDYYKISAGKG